MNDMHCRTCTLCLHVCVVAMYTVVIDKFWYVCVLLTIFIVSHPVCFYMVGMYTVYDLIIMYDIKYEQTIQLYCINNNYEVYCFIYF